MGKPIEPKKVSAMNIRDLKIGDRIRDIEDSDCFFEGIVASLNPIKYNVKLEVWNGIISNTPDKNNIELKWWLLEVFRNEWIKCIKE